MYGLELLKAHGELAAKLLEDFKKAVESNDKEEIRSLGNSAWRLSDNYEWGYSLTSDCTLCLAVYQLRQILLGDSKSLELYFKHLASTKELYWNGRFERNALGTMQIEWEAERLQKQYAGEFAEITGEVA